MATTSQIRFAQQEATTPELSQKTRACHEDSLQEHFGCRTCTATSSSAETKPMSHAAKSTSTCAQQQHIMCHKATHAACVRPSAHTQATAADRGGARLAPRNPTYSGRQYLQAPSCADPRYSGRQQPRAPSCICPAYCGRHHFGMHRAACTQATVARNNCRHRAAYTQPTMADSTCLGRTTCTDSTRVHRAAAPNIQWQTVLACTELHVQTAHACTELHVQKVQCSRFDPLQGLFPGPVLMNSNFSTFSLY